MNNATLTAIINPDILNNLKNYHNQLSLCHALEIRYDLFSDQSIWPNLSIQLKELFPKAILIGTIRKKNDGGNFSNNDDNKRLLAWKNILNDKHCLNWVDIEYESIKLVDAIRILSKNKSLKILISRHDFFEMPSIIDLNEFISKSIKYNSNGIKLACTAQNLNDEKKLYQIIKDHSSNFDNFSFFSMNEKYKQSRIISPLLSNSQTFVYGYLDKATAPGQFKISQLKNILLKAQSLFPKAYESTSDELINGISTIITSL